MNPGNPSITLQADQLTEHLAFENLAAEFFEELATHATSMIDVAKEGFSVNLDWSRASLEGLEQVLAECADHMAQAEISPASEQAQMLIVMASAYLGEVFRKAMGGGWYTLRTAGTGDGQLCLRTGGEKPTVLLPPTRVTNRLTRGAEFNVWLYAQAVWAVGD